MKRVQSEPGAEAVALASDAKKSKVASSSASGSSPSSSSSSSASTESERPKITLEFFRNASIRLEAIVNPRRTRTLKAATPGAAPGAGPIVYWMSRDQRVQDNWALVYAQQCARALRRPLVVVFNSVPTFMNAPVRHFDFMLRGLREVEQDLKALHIPFYVVSGQPAHTVSALACALDAPHVICDFGPLRVAREWRAALAAALPASVQLTEVDAHNVVPAWLASDKQEYSAATFRRKMETHYAEFLTEMPYVTAHEHAFDGDRSVVALTDASLVVFGGGGVAVDWEALQARLRCDASVPPVVHIRPGSRAALAALVVLVTQKIARYAEWRNQPQLDAVSNLSPYLHYGQLAPQRAVLCALNYKKSHKESVDSFFEETVVRRELADNYCLFQPHYDSTLGFAQWARDSLALHAADKREYVYTEREFDEGATHDDLWNAAQMEMVHAGKMHGFMRMYWAKKILEWSESPAEALRIALKLNDRYELDGRDPSGFVGCAWAIGGIHDMGWAERPVFGKIRYMNYAGCKRKFDIQAYISRVRTLVKAATGK